MSKKMSNASTLPAPTPKKYATVAEKWGVEENVGVLLSMLTYCRCHGSEGERQFTERFIKSLPGVYPMYGPKEEVAAYVVEVLSEDGTYPPVLFSAHLDSVHWIEAGPRQPVDFDANLGLALTVEKQPLGADDATGVWLLTRMINDGVPGVYVFPRGEEKGGIGSSLLADHHAEWLSQFDYAIAFDRRGTGDVITHQSCGRCCSDSFAKSLAAALNEFGLCYAPCDGGVFTDTANWIEHIPECVNLSVGYDHEHSADELQDVEHAQALLNAVLNIDWEALPVVRKPGPPDYSEYGFGWGRPSKWGSDWGNLKSNWLDKNNWIPDGEDETDDLFTPSELRSEGEKWKDDPDNFFDLQQLLSMSKRELIQLAEEDPAYFALSVYYVLDDLVAGDS